MKARRNIKPLLLYTMTSGLGDFIILSDLISKVEKLMPEAHCWVVHRDNPHVHLWSKDNPFKRFYNIYNPARILSLICNLKKARKDGYIILGLQMAPGSLQGHYFYTFLKKAGALDYRVDFNLINSDIITPRRGSYIFDIHLNQIQDLLKVDIPSDYYQLNLPLKASNKVDSMINNKIIGIHPWSRRGHSASFVWPFTKWMEVIAYLIEHKAGEIVVFGKDVRFDEFKTYLSGKLGASFSCVKFMPCCSVKELIDVIAGVDMLVSVNTSVVHIGYALGKKMTVLCGPSLDLWIPKNNNIHIILDQRAIFSGSDKPTNDRRMSTVQRIEVKEVIDSIRTLERNDTKQSNESTEICA